MGNLVSIIIGIYNVKRFIEKGIKQLLNQTYKNIEVILVDDGSTDGSYEICQNWAKEYKNIRVLHQENKGLGSARNLGIEHAKGSYIYFYDVDDDISPNLIEYNVSMMDQYLTDMVVFGYTSVDVTYNSAATVIFQQRLVENNLQLRDIYVDEFVLKMNGFAWNKFYSKDFIDKHNLRFENQRIQQDEVFNLLCYQHVEKMYISSEVFHTYYIYNDGNTRSRYIADRFDIYKSVRQHFDDIKTFWKIEDKRFDDYLCKRFYDSVLSCILFNLMHEDCPLSDFQKKQTISEIMSYPQTIEAFEYADRANLGLEQYLYRYVCKMQSLWQIKSCIKFFSIVKSAYSKLRKYGKTNI